MRVDLKEGRTPAQIEELHRRLATVVSEIVEVPLDSVRTYITQFPATAWGVGGVPSAAVTDR
ncbi:tautomerase family protein [Microbacterium sp. CPCC 204701]|uniref:tautomerase family protein n=1 Tax=Microbacterium sp. CPCC 204701 TaxID=2493084 RepID=UPI0013E37E9C